MSQLFRYISILAFLALLWSCEGTNDSISSNADDSSDDISLHYGKDNSSYSMGNGGVEYELTITNLTPAIMAGASQPLSPPVIAVHKKRNPIYKLRKRASKELTQLAEDAVNGPLVEWLNNKRGVKYVVEGTGVIHPGQSETINFTASKKARRVSLASMLVNTNDAFAGMNSVKVPKHGSKTVYLWAYDAGTEKNTEAFSDIPGPCCGNPFVRVPEHKRIRRHKGIKGTGDLDPATWGWEGPVAKVTITRVSY